MRFTNKINILSIFINSTDNGKIEVFKSVEELKKFLKDNEFPDIPAVKLYESTK